MMFTFERITHSLFRITNNRTRQSVMICKYADMSNTSYLKDGGRTRVHFAKWDGTHVFGFPDRAGYQVGDPSFKSILDALRSVRWAETPLGFAPIETTEDGIEIYSICDWFDHVAPGMDGGVLYEVVNEKFRQWCLDNEVHYYARPREDFFMWEAVEECRENDLKRVIVEDLS